MKKLSIIIPTHNEADNIQAAIESVLWADEIIVVDSFSEDETMKIAKAYTNFVVQRKYIGPADQKNWAIAQATHDWALILDADERVTPALKTEIQTLLQQEELPYDAYWIKRQNYFMKQQVRYSAWQGDAVIRLIRTEKCRYNNKQVHEEIETNNIKISQLNHSLQHFTFKNTSHFLAKLDRYADWSAQDHLTKTPKVGYYHLFIKPLFRFFKHYIWGRGFMDGKVGLIISLLMAWSVFLRYLKIKEIRDIKAL